MANHQIKWEAFDRHELINYKHRVGGKYKRCEVSIPVGARQRAAATKIPAAPHVRALRAQHHLGACSTKLTHPIIVVFEG